MNWSEPDGANLTLGEDQPEYVTIKVRREVVNYDFNGTLIAVGQFVAKIEPTPEEREAIANGASLYLTIMADRWPPCTITVNDPLIEGPIQHGTAN